MKKTILIFFLAAMCNGLSGITFTANAGVIGSTEIEHGGGSIGVFTSASVWTCLGCDPAPGYTPAYLFEDISFDTSHIGQTVTVKQSVDPDFNTYVYYLTNGINNNIEFGFNGGVGIGVYGSVEANIFFGDYTGANGIDFKGYTIDSISLTVNDIMFDNDGNWTDYHFEGTMAIHGNVVPEPISSILFFTGGTLLAGRRYWKKRRPI